VAAGGGRILIRDPKEIHHCPHPVNGCFTETSDLDVLRNHAARHHESQMPDKPRGMCDRAEH
jgi:hypothetical protein